MRLILCDDHRIFTDALSRLLTNAGHEIIGLFDDPTEAADSLRRLAVDACLVDFSLPGYEGATGVAEVAAAARSAGIVVLTALADPAALQEALSVGAHGIALKTDDLAEILRVVSQVVARSPHDRPVISSGALRASTRALASSDRVAEHPLARFLTPREREVLRRLVAGEATATLAAGMGIQVSTARSHVDAILTKLGAHSRIQAISYAVSEGLVDIPTWEGGDRSGGVQGADRRGSPAARSGP